MNREVSPHPENAVGQGIDSQVRRSLKADAQANPKGVAYVSPGFLNPGKNVERPVDPEGVA